MRESLAREALTKYRDELLKHIGSALADKAMEDGTFNGERMRADEMRLAVVERLLTSEHWVASLAEEK